MDLKERILESTIRLFNEKGLKFTMDDIASDLSISKKTIYTVFKDKESLCTGVVDYVFDSIKQSENEVLNRNNPDTISQLKELLGVMPESYSHVDMQELYQLKDKYPTVYDHLAKRLENGWEATIGLIEKGISEGTIRPISIPIFKTMMEDTLEQFFQRDVLHQNDISYQDALKEVVDILVDGIRKEAHD